MTLSGRIRRYLHSRHELKAQFMRPFQQFFRKEASSSILLISVTAVALLWANSPYSGAYFHFWETPLRFSFSEYGIARSLKEWIADGLMALFFFTVGLEIKREILVGELAGMKRAVLPVSAALGGMLFPALVYYAFNYGTAAAGGWGIPMATDIAFALGMLYVLGKRVPSELRIFLSAFAIADDIGAVLVIAIFYTKEISMGYLAVSALIVFMLALANFFWIRRTIVYAVLGTALWVTVLASGIHSTVAGIIVAMFIPARGKYDTDRFLQNVSRFLGEFRCPPHGCGHSILLNRRHLNAVQSIEMACHDVETPLQRLEQALHPWVAFLVIPLFAMANVGVALGGAELVHAATSPISLGIMLGLLVGKPLGITLFTYLPVRMGLASLSPRLRWGHIAAAGMTGGIGFTMSLFIAGLSLEGTGLYDTAKVGIIAGSVLSSAAGIITFSFLWRAEGGRSP